MSTEATAGTSKFKARMILLLIGGVPLVVAAVSTWLWVYVVNGDIDLVGILGTRNHGELVQPPVQIDDHVMQNTDGTPFKYSELPQKWTFVVNIDEPCDSSCEQALYVARQSHVALGKEFNRIQRIAVSTSAEQLLAWDEKLQDEYLNMRAVLVDSKLIDILQKRETTSNDSIPQAESRDNIYVIDPRGWIMMKYNEHHIGRQILDDMKFLLKYSSEE